MKTKICPGCKNTVPWNKPQCTCGYDFTLEPCPGCDQRIDPDAVTCPHCDYNMLLGMVPPPKEVPKRRRRSQPEAVTLPPRQLVTVHVPPLGRMGQQDIDIPEMHWPRGQEVTDANLKKWGERLRIAWREKVCAADHLSNHAIGYLASVSGDKSLEKNSDRIVKLLGGDDWK